MFVWVLRTSCLIINSSRASSHVGWLKGEPEKNLLSSAAMKAPDHKDLYGLLEWKNINLFINFPAETVTMIFITLEKSIDF